MMRFTVIAVGRAKNGVLRSLWQDYADRLHPPVQLKEIDDRRPGSTTERRRREAAALLAAVPSAARIIALDEKGRDLASPQIAKQLGDWRDAGQADVAFILGGADGLDETVRSAAHLTLALGRQTWPHMLARAMVIEQIYRAQQILSGHPYHRD
jgi:23S rRNA (pseudouridine1915-N3)-methyltransferase